MSAAAAYAHRPARLPRTRMRLTDMVTPLKRWKRWRSASLGRSDVGGHRELVRDGETGVLFKAGDRPILRGGLRVLADASLQARLVANGPPEIRRERNWPIP